MEGLIRDAAQVIRNGGTVVFPTETVYGIGANALDPIAVARIFEIKNRPRFNPLIVHLPAAELLGDVASEVPDQARLLAERFWPGPLTLVLPRQESIPAIVSAGLATVAVRVPSHPLAQSLLNACGVPIAAPSANRSTRLSPTRVEHAEQQLGTEVDMYLDGGRCQLGLESTIVGWVDGAATLLRKGAVAAEAIEDVIGPLAPAAAGGRPLAPGALTRHYSPRTPLLFSEKPVVFDRKRRVGLLSLRPGDLEDGQYTAVSYLSVDGDLKQAAASLFHCLHEMEAMNLDLIVARPLPEQGLGAAINDRLRRASLSDDSQLA